MQQHEWGLTDILIVYPTTEGRVIEVVIYYAGFQQGEKVVRTV